MGQHGRVLSPGTTQEQTRQTMKNIIKLFCLAALAVPGIASAPNAAMAQATGTAEFTVHSRATGELSPDTQAPGVATLMNAIDASSPSQLAALLEYGERVECHACVPLLQRRMLDPGEDATVREMAAWWLRRRPFGMGAIMRETRMVLAGDADPARRAVAADAIGEFMDPHGVAHLGNALMTDTSVVVRVAAVRGLARINSPAGLSFLSVALGDASPEVVQAGLRSVLRVNFFRDQEALRSPSRCAGDRHARCRGIGSRARGDGRGRHRRDGTSGGGVGARSHRDAGGAQCADGGSCHGDVAPSARRDRSRSSDVKQLV